MTVGVLKLNRDDYILVLENPAGVERSLRQALMAKGYARVVAAATEEEAVALARRSRPDVVILNQPPDASREESSNLSAAGERIRQGAELKGVPFLKIAAPSPV